MMTSMALHDSICDFLDTRITPQFNLPAQIGTGKNKEKTLRRPAVYRSGFLLPKSAGGKGDDVIAFMLPWLRKVENIRGERESVATIEILYGVCAGVEYDEGGEKIDDGGGYRDLWNLIETTRQAFFTTATLGDMFMIVPDFFEAEMLAEQIYPYWEGFCRTRWHIGYPLPPPGEKFF